MGRIVIVAYRPKQGKEAELDILVSQHTSTLRAEGLITDRKPIAMRSKEGTVLEVFEWASAEAISLAHNNSRVQSMWDKFSRVCDYIPVAQVNECASVFSEFEPLH